MRERERRGGRQGEKQEDKVGRGREGRYRYRGMTPFIVIKF